MFGNFVLVEVRQFLFFDEFWKLVQKLPVMRFNISWYFFFMVEFQWFFIELSVRPGSILVISAHLLPWALCAKNKVHYSWLDQSTLRIQGFKWLCQRSRNCFPSRPGTCLAIMDHRWGPCFYTNFLTRLSYSSVQGFFLRNLSPLGLSCWRDSLCSGSSISLSHGFLPILI